MTPRILGLVALVLGMALLIMGLNASDSLAHQLKLSETFTAYPIDRTAWYIIGGVALAITGLMLTLIGLGYGHHHPHGRLA